MWVGATLCADVAFIVCGGTKGDANMVGARSFFVCNAVMLFSSVPKTLSRCCTGSEGGSVGGDHRIQLLFAVSTFSDYRQFHFSDYKHDRR